MNEYLLNIQIFILWANYTTRQQCALVDNSVKSGWKASYSVCILAASSEEELGVKASEVSTNKLLQWVSGQARAGLITAIYQTKIRNIQIGPTVTLL